ncbi:MAG: hypothetical protein MR508_09750 [Lachnospiraceae bacterium]|nr:hypothetical protein [Lachnospiraceae bacterium]
MRKQWKRLMGFLCYGAGIVCSLYYGLWKLLVLPVGSLISAWMAGTITLTFVVACGIKILVSTTLAGLIWCIGYMGYNYFKGTDDPDWEAMEEHYREKTEEGRHTL